ncbi:PLC-like phosphodiesterase [Vararia minispora EC-137]|uniref:PLC-like phosphodiesterase n=1 Tax=Vararia minispora EC-137 TaxID=1314806 RepID=A0ACB8QNZ3_9AGAM|nr:PLC-like phosphodiesterase [Vararia minispora EC-137]
MVDRMQSWVDDLHHLQEHKGVDSLVHIQPPTNKEVRLSPGVAEYLQEHGESKDELLQRPVIVPPPIDDSRPLTHYFISSSHNTYLLSRQILGKASALAYVHVLWRHARCVELDVWPSSDGTDLIVTHGYTLSSSVPLREVCEAIGAAVRPGDWPVFASLECHVALERQKVLVGIMKEVWGEKLIDSAVVATGTTVTPGDLRGKIVVMVEYYPEQAPRSGESAPDIPGPSWSDLSLSEGEEEALEEKKDEGPANADKTPPKISDALAQLGLYVRSLKPGNGWFDQSASEPQNIMINISESALSSLLPQHTSALIVHAASHLRRVYPRGTRVASSNLDPSRFWRTGTHISALNWQKYDRGTQMNEAMFAGTPGFVLKPDRLIPGLTDDSEPCPRQRLKCEAIGLSSLPVDDKSQMGAYIRVQLYHPGGKHQWRSKTVKCTGTKECSHLADFSWNETFEFEYDDDGLVFLRIVVLHNVSFGRDAHQAVFVARTEYVEDGLHAIRMLSPKGKDLGTTLLLRVQFEDL